MRAFPAIWFSWSSAVFLLAAAAISPADAGVYVDNFDVGGASSILIVTAMSGPAMATQSAPTADIIGGERESALVYSSGSGLAEVDIDASPFFPDQLSFDQMGSIKTTLTLVYDGTTPAGLNAPLATFGDSFVFEGIFALAPVSFQMNVATFGMGGGISTYSGFLPTSGSFIVPFGLFTPLLMMGPGADFSDIDRITVFLRPGAGVDMALDSISVAQNPEPSSVVIWGLLGMAGSALWRRRQGIARVARQQLA